MVAYSFQPRFAPLIETGAKRQTVRGPRRRHARPGEPLQLYVGLRTPAPRKLVTPDPPCLSVTPLVLDVQPEPHGLAIRGWLDGAPIADMEAFARADGFVDAADMTAWFRSVRGAKRLPDLVLIRWDWPPERKP